MTECSISNLGTCIVDKLFEFILYLLNLPLKQLLGYIRDFLIKPVNINLFSESWAIIIYILSLTYGLILLFIGLKFIISGYSPEQKERAKIWLANVLVMIVLVQASFILYEIILDLVASFSGVIYNMIPSSFFLITVGTFENVALELFLLIPYVITLITTLILLSLRYICVSIGVIFFAIGIFLYYIEPLKAYGKLILNFLGVLISLPFFYSMILLASSKFLSVEVFSDTKILVMIGGFTLVNTITIILLLFVIIKAALAVKTPIKQIQSILPQ